MSTCVICRSVIITVEYCQGFKETHIAMDTQEEKQKVAATPCEVCGGRMGGAVTKGLNL